MLSSLSGFRAAVPLWQHGRRCLHAACAPTESLRKLQQPASVHSTSAVNAADSGDLAATADPPRRRRRKLFTSTGTQSPDEERASQRQAQQPPEQQQAQQQQQQRQQRRRRQQQQQRQAEEQGGWWENPAAASELLLHVFWDLDNLHPDHWEQADELVGVLKSVLGPFGRLQQLQAYANSRTLVSTVGVDGIEDLVEEQVEELRCEICGRRCKSFDDLQKHFKQLHEREHKKRLRAPKKAASKYAASDKAARVRDAGRLYGTPKKNRSGRRGQMVKVVLQRAGVKVLEVASQKQAADDAINRHMEALLHQLAVAEPVPASPSTGRAAATGGTQGEADTPGVRPHTEGSASTALQQSVLVIISDDRGFASSVARWLRSGQAAGAWLISTRGMQGWEGPLLAAFRSCGLAASPWQSVAVTSWYEVLNELDDGVVHVGPEFLGLHAYNFLFADDTSDERFDADEFWA